MASVPLRDITEQEWQDIGGEDFNAFKGMPLTELISNKKIRVSGEASPKYNCVAWSLQRQDRWIKPESYLDKYCMFINRSQCSSVIMTYPFCR